MARSRAMSKLQHTELIAFVLGVIVLGFLVFERRRIVEAARGPGPALAFVLFVLSWGASIVEEGPDAGLFDLLQHTASAAGALVLAAWILRCGRGVEDEGTP